jgi:hypothetical protein
MRRILIAVAGDFGGIDNGGFSGARHDWPEKRQGPSLYPIFLGKPEAALIPLHHKDT